MAARAYPFLMLLVLPVLRHGDAAGGAEWPPLRPFGEGIELLRLPQGEEPCHDLGLVFEQTVDDLFDLFGFHGAKTPLSSRLRRPIRQNKPIGGGWTKASPLSIENGLGSRFVLATRIISRRKSLPYQSFSITEPTVDKRNRKVYVIQVIRKGRKAADLL